MLSKFIKFFLYMFFFSIIIFFCSIFYFYFFISKPSRCEKNIICVEKVTHNYLSFLLLNNHISENFEITNFSLRMLKKLGYVPRVGEYQIPKYVSIKKAMEIFSIAKPFRRKFTIPEGLPVSLVLKKLEAEENLLGEIKDIPEEGSLMPDTYVFYYPTSKSDIILRAQKAMKKFLADNWPTRDALCNLNSPEEAIILASIVEKETAVEHDLIAGVFFNRLNKKMRLQSCPTVIYGITKGEPLRRKLLSKDLQIDHPCNTYKNLGLPLTPITNPGKKSIFAVLHPQKTDYLFFVLGKNRKHLFSKTFKEHILKKVKLSKSAKIPK